MIIARLLYGWFGTYERADNELEVVSTISDPAKIRFAVQAENVEQNIGADSFNILRPDGIHEEYATAGCRVSHEHGGSFAIATRARGEDDVKERLLINATGAVFNVPVVAPNLTDLAGWTARVLRAPGGETELHMQGDGNLVVYDVRTKPWTPLWATAHGKIRDFRSDGKY